MGGRSYSEQFPYTLFKCCCDRGGALTSRQHVLHALSNISRGAAVVKLPLLLSPHMCGAI